MDEWKINALVAQYEGTVAKRSHLYGEMGIAWRILNARAQKVVSEIGDLSDLAQQGYDDITFQQKVKTSGIDKTIGGLVENINKQLEKQPSKIQEQYKIDPDQIPDALKNQKLYDALF